MPSRSARLFVSIVLSSTAAAAAPLPAAAQGSGARRSGDAAVTHPHVPRVALRPCHKPGVDQPLRCGTLRVYEDRDRGAGRRIPLDIVVLPSRSPTPQPDPVFSLYGGPGQTPSEYVEDEWSAWYRDEREVVLVDQRGSGGPHPLNCRLPGSDDDLQGYFESQFQPAAYRACVRELGRYADLRLYSTPIAMDDLDDVRRALGYDRINLVGGSYGSRAELVYIKRHGAHVRSAVVLGVNAFSFKNPLYHAHSAQRALDLIFDECGRQPRCHAALPEVRREFAAVMDRLASHPARVTIAHPRTRAPVAVTLGRQQFAEALRVMTYAPQSVRKVPLAIHRAYEGDLRPFAIAGLASTSGLNSILRMGMLMAVTCSEDVARITEDEIVHETRNTYLGDERVRSEMAACREFPRSRLPADYAAPFRSDVPALLIAGYYDAATPPRFAEEVARDYLPNSALVLIRTAGHSATAPCTDAIGREFLRRGSVEGLDTSCAAAVQIAPFATTDADAADS